MTFLKQATTDTSGHNALSPQFDPGKVATYALGVSNDPQSGWGNYMAQPGGKIIPYPYASTTSVTTPAVQQGMSFLTGTLTNDHVIVPGAETGPNANGNNLLTAVLPGPGGHVGGRRLEHPTVKAT